MPFEQLWERVCKSAQRIAHAGKDAWSELTDTLQPPSTEGLPETVALEDRVLFNAAPIDVAALFAVQTQAGQVADVPSEGHASAEAPTEGLGDHALGMPAGDGGEAAADSGGLLAPDQNISVNPEDRIVASFDLGGTNNPHARNLGFAIDRTGWEVFIQDRLEPLLEAGISRIELHTPFGQRSLIVDPVTGEVTRPEGQWGFQFDAYLDAQREVPKATEDFVSAFQDFFARHESDGKLQDVIPYIGSPRLDADQLALVNNPEAWWDRAYDVLTPLLEAGFRSIGFDASATATPDTLDYELHNVLRYPELRDPVRDARLIEIVGDERVEVYLEAMPLRSTGRTDFPVAILDRDFVHQDPERPGIHFNFRQKNFFEHDRLTGEMIRIVRHEQWQAEGHLPVQRILLEGDVAAVTPIHMLRPQNGGAESLADYLDMMDLPSLPTDVDLDPDDLNPDTAEYTITSGPTHGTLTPNRFHGDVFTYIPDAYFTGVDSFEYVVQDASGASATAVVTFFVNTPVVESPEPAPPSGLPGTAPPPAGPSGGQAESPQDPGTSAGPPSDQNSGDPPASPTDPAGPGTFEPPGGDSDEPGETGGAGAPSPTLPSPPVQVPSSQDGPAVIPSEDDVEDGLEAPDEPATPGELPPNGSAGDETEIDQGTTGGSTGSSTPPASATPDSTVDTVEDLASGGSQSPGPQVAPVLLPDSEEFRSLQEDLEELGLLAGASSVELLDNPQGPTLRVQYGFGVLQFLVSSMYDWLPRN